MDDFYKHLEYIEALVKPKDKALACCEVLFPYMRHARYWHTKQALYGTMSYCCDILKDLHDVREILKEGDKALQGKSFIYIRLHGMVLSCVMISEDDYDIADFYDELDDFISDLLCERRDIFYHNIPKGMYDYDGYTSAIKQAHKDANSMARSFLSRAFKNNHGIKILKEKK